MQVDVLTSNKVLAKRDAEDQKLVSFYKRLHLTVAHNTKKQEKLEYNKCYDADIVFGDISSFQRDFLSKFKGNRNVSVSIWFVFVLILTLKFDVICFYVNDSNFATF